eukprot:GHVU01033018.1.p2 GENE.GHVU01033018.1~~GHVU01033018.1.p2  ORF type:complete len:139 (-),score=6.48 GHVU01033018.1:704-1120(-)
MVPSLKLVRLFFRPIFSLHIFLQGGGGSPARAVPPQTGPRAPHTWASACTHTSTDSDTHRDAETAAGPWADRPSQRAVSGTSWELPLAATTLSQRRGRRRTPNTEADAIVASGRASVTHFLDMHSTSTRSPPAPPGHS